MEHQVADLASIARGLRRRWGRVHTSGRRLARRLRLLTEPPATALIAAARAGDTLGVGRLLQAGAAVDARGQRRRTALHAAARGGHAEVAARLLAHGADHTIVDRTGRTALGRESIGLEELHAVRQRFHRLDRHDPAFVATAEAQRWARALDEHGIVKVAGLISSEALGRMRAAVERFVANVDALLARGAGTKRHYDEEEHLWARDRAYVTNNAFKYSPELVRFCCNESLVHAASIHVGQRAYVQRGLIMRYLPSGSSDDDMFRWHHDLEERRCKVMVLLTDVGPDDQHMRYVLGSHLPYHPLEMFRTNRYDLEYCRRQVGRMRIYDALGVAGDVFLFDSNGAHVGVRRETGRVRDVFLVELTNDRSNVWGGDVDPRIFDGVPLPGYNPFERLLAAEKKWERPRRKAPTWIETLANVDAWR